MSSLEIGVVGLANVGKSTLFNALTKANVPALNYPFCTIEPNVGVVMIPDQRLLQVADLIKPKKVTGAGIRFVDIAGLVKGASRGEGLGNKFLAHIREVDAILHVVRFFADPNVAKVEGSVDPLLDIAIVETELILADMQTLENRIERTERLLKTGERQYREELDILVKVREALNQGIPVRRGGWDLPQDLMLITDKPVLYVLNVAEEDLLEQAQLLDKLAPLLGKVREEDSQLILLAATLEAEIVDLPPEDGQQFMAELGIAESGLTQVINGGLGLLNLVTFYTIKGDETRAWLVPEGTLAPQAAGKIHTDMERGFIKADVIQWDQLLASGSLSKAREQGLVRLEGREYPVKDGDVIQFHFNV